MTSIRLPSTYEDNKTYPILIKLGGGHMIREMSGKHIKAYNRAVLCCSDCAMENLHQPCEACPNYWKRNGSNN